MFHTHHEHSPRSLFASNGENSSRTPHSGRRCETYRDRDETSQHRVHQRPSALEPATLRLLARNQDIRKIGGNGRCESLGTANGRGWMTCLQNFSAQILQPPQPAFPSQCFPSGNPYLKPFHTRHQRTYHANSPGRTAMINVNCTLSRRAALIVMRGELCTAPAPRCLHKTAWLLDDLQSWLSCRHPLRTPRPS